MGLGCRGDLCTTPGSIFVSMRFNDRVALTGVSPSYTSLRLWSIFLMVSPFSLSSGRMTGVFRHADRELSSRLCIGFLHKLLARDFHAVGGERDQRHRLIVWSER